MVFAKPPAVNLVDLESILGREIKLGGIVSGVEHRTTKTGKPFGKFTLEDYTGNYTFTLFGEDYLKFKNFMNIGWFLFVEGAVIKNTWGQQNVEVKIRNIDLLNELGVKRSKGVQLRINSIDLNRRHDYRYRRCLSNVCRKYTALSKDSG